MGKTSRRFSLWYQQQKLIHQIGWIILIGFLVSFFLTLFLLSYDKSVRMSQLSVSGALQRVVSLADTLEQTPDNLHRSILNASRSSDLQLSLSQIPAVNVNKHPSDMEQQLLNHLYHSGIENAHLRLSSQRNWPEMTIPERHTPLPRHHSMMNDGGMMNDNGMMSRYSTRFENSQRSPIHYRATISGSVKLPSGLWLNFSSGIANDITHWSTSVLVALGVVMAMTILISLLIIRRALKPIDELGKAALSFARNKQVQEVNNAGPRDLAPTLKAFNDMQHQVTDYIAERTKLLAAISHDLRTPLTSLRLRLEFIDDSDDKAQMLRTLNTMEKMLTETMRFAKNDAKKEPRQMTDINSLLQTIVDDYDEKGIEINYQEQTGLKGNIPALSVRRMTENLINNAIQYAGNNADIRVSVRASQTLLIICVADTGIGIPQEKLQEVMKPFSRLNEARDTDSSNVGLGLSITHSLASSYGGALTLEPNIPQGLRATITLALNE